MSRMPTLLLVLAAVGALTVDLLVAGPRAHAENGEPSDPEPVALPLFGVGFAEAPEGELGDLQLRTEVADDGAYEVQITNPTTERLDLELSLALSSLQSERQSRMGPLPTMIHREELVAPIAAGETLRHRLVGVRSPVVEEAGEQVPVLGELLSADLSQAVLTVQRADLPLVHVTLSVGYGAPQLVSP